MPKNRPNQRANPKSLVVRPVPAGLDLTAVARKCRYVGSPYHKDRPSFAGMPQTRRPAGSICPSYLAERQALVQTWLEEAIIRGNTGRWDASGQFPLEVFHQVDDVVFQALTKPHLNGEYHGFPLEPWQKVQALRP